MSIDRRRAAITAEKWNVALESFRVFPGNCLKASAASGLNRRTVKRLWVEGFPGTTWGARPMQEIVENEKTEAAARRLEKAERNNRVHPIITGGHAAIAAAASLPVPSPDVVVMARADAIAVRGEEAKLLKFARGNVQALLSMVVHLQSGGLDLAKRIEKTIKDDKTMSAAQAMLMIARIAQVTQKALYATQTVVEIERDIVGDPAKRAEEELSEEMTQEDAIEEIERAAALWDRMKQKGLRVIPGGATESVAPAEGEAVKSPNQAVPPDASGTDTVSPSADPEDEDDVDL